MPSSNARKSGRKLRWVIRAGGALGAAAITLVIALWLVRLPVELNYPAPAVPRLVDVQGRVLAVVPQGEMRDSAPYALGAMGQWLPAVTVALEDHRFHEHPGCDAYAAAAAAWRNLRGGRILSGGSTITQQLIKIASHRRGRSWQAKLYENLAALRIERLWNKNRILEAYLNRSDYGNRRFGPAAAAQAYFRKRPEKLTLAEAIYLAGLPQAPTRFNPWRRPAEAREKFARSVARLLQLGFVTPEQAANLRVPSIAAPEDEPRPAPHFVDAILRNQRNLPGGIVVTTLDLDLQKIARARLRAHLTRLAGRGVRDGAVVIVDIRDGAVRAMVGSPDYEQRQRGQVNGATLFRSAGSTLKPFLYAKALDERLLTAATLLPDTPDAVRAEYIDYDPLNYDKRFWGPVRVREALANSLNVPAVVTLSRVGARNAYAAMEECGLVFARPFSEYGAGLILGNAEVRLLDLTAAYTLFAGGGLAVEARLLAEAPVRHRAFGALDAASIVGDILCDNDARLRSFSAFSPLAFEEQRIPCKTGTSSGFRDGWTIGVTGQHAVGVWVGNFDGRPMHEIAAIAGAAPIFNEIVHALLARGDTSVPGPAGSNLVAAPVCRLTGMRPIPESPGTIKEWFLSGTEPKDDAGRLLRKTDGRVQLLLPAEYGLWCSTPLNYLNAIVDRSTALRVINPAQDSTYLVDPHLPRSQQALRLLAVGGGEEQQVWRINGEPVPVSEYGFFWPLRQGRYTAEVTSGNEKVTVQFAVK